MIALLFSAVIGLLMSGQPTPQPAAAGTAEIRGRIVDAETGAPLKQCTVRLGSTDGRQAYSTVSDERGDYRIATLPAGRYVGMVEAPRFRAEHLAALVQEEGRSGLTLKGGEVRELNIRLKRAFVLTARVTDEDGEPLSGIQIALRSADGTDQVLPNWTRMTDDRGLLRVIKVPPGRYRVCAEAQPLTTTASDGAASREQLLRTCHPSTLDEERARLVTVGGDGAAEVDFVMRRGRTFTIRGTVVDASGAPAAQANLNLSYYVDNGGSSRGVNVGADGRFRITNVTPGYYAVTASLGGDLRAELRRDSEAAFVPLHLDTADAEDLVVRMSKTVTVKGRVVPEEAGAVLPPSQGPGLALSARHVEDRLPGSGEMRIGRVDKAGGFSVSGLFGSQLIEVVNLPRGWYVKSMRYRGDDVTGMPIAFRADAESALEITVSTRGAAVTGTVAEDNGTPAAGVRVIAFPAEPDLWGMTETEATSTRAGTFRVGPLRAGSYFVAALGSGWPSARPGDRRTLARIAEVAERITLNAEEERVLALQPIRPE